MATKKPSLTKQIGEVLGTDDKHEQLARIQELIGKSNAPVAAVTVLFDGDISISVAADGRLGAGDVKSILMMAIEDITKQVVRAEMEAEEAVVAGEGVPELPEITPE